jgi:hypothetical protein
VGLQANKSQHDSGKDRGDSGRWKCRTHKTDKHVWAECYSNRESKSFSGNDKAKKEGEASTATLNLDGVPFDLLLQLSQTGVLHRGSVSITMGVTTTALVRKDDALAAGGEGERQHADG